MKKILLVNQLFNKIQQCRGELEAIRRTEEEIDNDVINVAEALVREIKSCQTYQKNKCK